MESDEQQVKDVLEASWSADTRKVSLYRLIGEGPLREYVALKTDEHEDDYPKTDVDVGGEQGLLVAGWADPQPVEWTSMVAMLTGVSLGYERRVAAAAIFVRVDEATFAITFNQGWRFVRDSRIDRGFGIDFAVRVADDEEIQQVTRWALSAKARVDRNAVPGGQGLWSFGLREHAELVRQLTAKARADLPVRLTHMRPKAHRRNPRLRLECADGVKLPLSVEGIGMVADLREINRILREFPVSPALEPLRWVRRVATGATERDELNLAVADMLVNPDSGCGEIGISYPAKYFDGPDVHRYKGAIGDAPIDTDELTLSDLAIGLRDRLPEMRLQALQAGHIDGYDEEGRASSEGMSALQWIAAEVDIDESRHVLLDGDWFALGDEYLRHVDGVVEKAFASEPPWRLPAWRSAPRNKNGRIDEGDYNEHVADVDKRFLCMDKKLVQTRVHPRGFEACDLLGPNDALVHVKRTSSSTGSSPLSHLFAQGLVAAESFTNPETWAKFQALVAAQSPERAARMGRRPGSLVYAIHRSDKPLRPGTLFTFARSTLVSAWTTLTTYGIPVHIAVIP